jgi:hypothetical protein
MRNINKFICICFLTGCASTSPKIETVVKVERIVVVPPAEFLRIPPYPMEIDFQYATQRTVADWIIKTEERMQILEQQILSIDKFYKEIKK